MVAYFFLGVRTHGEGNRQIRRSMEYKSRQYRRTAKRDLRDLELLRSQKKLFYFYVLKGGAIGAFGVCAE